MVKRLKGKREKQQLFQTKKRIERISRKELKEKKKRSERKLKAFLGALKPKKLKASRRAVSRREIGTRRLITALGGETQRKGRGRPSGTYKYGMPIGQYKKLQSRKRALQSQYQQEQMAKFRRKGITPEQLQRMQLLKLQEEGMPQQFAQRKKGDIPGDIVDEELAFKRWEAKKILSPSAQRILTRLRRVQNKGKSDNIRQQRIQEERRIISQKGNLMRAHENMIDVRVDFTGVKEDNILMAKSVFKENPEDNILRTKRFNILQTREAGNSIGF